MDGHEWVQMTRHEKTVYVVGFLSAFYWSSIDDQEIRDRVLTMSQRKIKLLVLMVDDFYKLRSNRYYQVAFPVFDAWIMLASPKEKTEQQSKLDRGSDFKEME